jgi:hypothetical protein
MKSFCVIAAVVFAVLATTPVTWAAQGKHLVVSNLKVPSRTQLQAGVPYLASIDIRTPGEAVQIEQFCFVWNTDGPYCFKQWEMKKGADGGVHPTIGLRTGNPGKYKLTSYMVYTFKGKTYETNQVSAGITVRQ